MGYYRLLTWYIFSRACFCNTHCWNLHNNNISHVTLTRMLMMHKTYFRSCSFSFTSRSNSASIVICVFLRCCMCCTAVTKKRGKNVNTMGGEESEREQTAAGSDYVLRCNKATLLIFLLRQLGNSFRKSSKPSLIWARRFCSDWI